MQSPRPTSSRTIYKNLRVALGGEPPDLVAHVLTLAVLFEDLRFELESFDGDAKHHHNLYFLRRSSGTLREFADCIRRMNGLACFEGVRKRFSSEQRGEWNTAVAFLKVHKARIDNERNVYGGHVSHGAVQKAVASFPYGENQSMEMHWIERDGASHAGPTFHFAGDVMTRVMLNGKPAGQDELLYFRELLEFMVDGFKRATTCVALVTNHYLGPLWGFASSSR